MVTDAKLPDKASRKPSNIRAPPFIFTAFCHPTLLQERGENKFPGIFPVSKRSVYESFRPEMSGTVHA